MKSLLGSARRSEIIFRANGHFDITARVVRELNLSAGDVVDILTQNGEYFLYVRINAEIAAEGRFEARVYPSRKKTGRHFRGSSARLCKAMLSACNAIEKAAMPCGEAFVDNFGRRLIPIIVRINIA